MECPECGYKIEDMELFVQFIHSLEEQIQKMPLQAESKCCNCGNIETIPGYRYCPCGYKLPQPFAQASNRSAEDIVAIVLDKFAPMDS